MDIETKEMSSEGPTVLDRIPLEILCQLLENLSNKQVAKCRFVSHRWNIAGAMTLSKILPPLPIFHVGNLVKFNSVMSSCSVNELFSNFEIHPRALLTADADEAVTKFLDNVGLAAKFYAFQPLDRAAQSLYAVDLSSHGRVLLQFLRNSQNLISLKINFQDEFALPDGGLESISATLQNLRHFTAIFPYKCCHYDGRLLLAAILQRSPRLTHLSLTYQFGGSMPKKDESLFFVDVLEILKELKHTVTLRIKMTSENPLVNLGVDSISLIGYSMLPHRFASIEFEIRSKNTDWDEILWQWSQTQSKFLTKLALQAFPAKTSLLNPFPKLHTFIIRRQMEEVSNLTLATAFQTVRVLDIGTISHSSVTSNFVGRLFNLEELKMKFEQGFDCWCAITGELVHRFRATNPVSKADENDATDEGASDTDSEDPDDVDIQEVLAENNITRNRFVYEDLQDDNSGGVDDDGDDPVDDDDDAPDDDEDDEDEDSENWVEYIFGKEVRELMTLEWQYACDTSPSPFLTLTKLKSLEITSDKTGFYGIVYISKLGSLKPLNELVLKPLQYVPEVRRRHFCCGPPRNVVRDKFQAQLETYHQHVEVLHSG